MTPLAITINSEAGTTALAASLARICATGDCILLHGDLGAGKTTFARGFIQEILTTPMEVVSPTFTLVQTYPVRCGMIWHFDLYRLRGPEELEELGIDEALNSGITLMEWPEIAQDALPRSALVDALDITISMGENAGERLITLTGSRHIWQERLSKIAK